MKQQSQQAQKAREQTKDARNEANKTRAQAQKERMKMQAEQKKQAKAQRAAAQTKARKATKKPTITKAIFKPKPVPVKPAIASTRTANPAGTLTALGTGAAAFGISIASNSTFDTAAKQRQKGLGCNSAGALGTNNRPAFLNSCLRWNSGTPTSLSGAYTQTTYKKVDDLIDAFKTSSLETELPGFSAATPNIEGRVYFNGVKVTASYTHSTANNVTTRVLDYSFTLNGKNYSAAMTDKITASDEALQNQLHKISKAAGDAQSIDQQLDKFFQSAAGQNFLTALQKATVEEAPYSPVAGNPASYMAQMVSNNYNIGERVDTPASYVQGIGMVSLTPGFSTYLMGTQVAQVYNLGIMLTHNIDTNDALILDLPLGITTIGDTKGYNMSLGLGLKHHFAPAWTVTPAFHAGGVAAADSGSGTLVYDASLTSDLNLPYQWDGLSVGMTNNVSYLATGSLTVGGYKTNYSINNVITENGLNATYHFKGPISLTMFGNNTSVVAGQKWYMDNSNQIGLRLNSINDAAKSTSKFVFSHINASIGYIFGAKDITGVQAKLGFNF